MYMQSIRFLCTVNFVAMELRLVRNLTRDCLGCDPAPGSVGAAALTSVSVGSDL